MKTYIWVLGLIVVAGGGYYAYSNGMFGEKGMSGSQNGQEQMMAEPTIDWKLADAGERENIPYTKVSVTVNGTTHEVGEFQGSCSEIGASGGVDGKGLLAGELSAVQCWFAGGGDEIGVFAVEDGGYEVLVGALEEPIEGGEGFRGDFTIRSDIRL